MLLPRGQALLAHLFALGTSAVWGLTFISSKILLETHTPLEIIVFRFTAATAFLFCLRPRLFRHGGGWRTELLFAGAGLFGVSVYFLLENTALLYTYASNTSVILCTAPFFTGLVCSAFLKERMGHTFFLGFVIAIAGIALISFNGASTLGLNPLGDFLAMLAALSWAIYSLLTRLIFDRGYPMLEATRRILLWGLASFVLFLPFQAKPFQMPDLMDPATVGHILFLGLLASGVCYSTWNHALRTIGAVKTTAYIYLSPVFTVLAAALVLDERITLLAAIGMILTLTGLLLSENPFALPDNVRNFGLRGKGQSFQDTTWVKTFKAVHMLFATAWAGGALSMQALNFLKLSTADPVEQAHAVWCLHFVDTYVVIPGLLGCIATGLFYSIFTAIGFFRNAWIGFKWLVVMGAGFWGTLFWGPWGNILIAKLEPWGLDAPVRFIKAFILPEDMWQGALQLAIILTMCLVSVFRPVYLADLLPWRWHQARPNRLGRPEKPEPEGKEDRAKDDRSMDDRP
jgi:drug/metabolite transporter (DMT)-like permease